MLCSLLRIRGMQLLVSILHLYSGLTADGGGTFAENFANFAHGSQLLCIANGLVSILATDAASRLLCCLLRIALALTFTLLRIFGGFGFLAVFALLGIAFLSAVLRFAVLPVLLGT